jgi:sulfate adenylyltransferase subunit 2
LHTATHSASTKPSLLGLDAPQVWDTERAYQHLQAIGEADTKRTAERRLHELRLLPSEITVETLRDEFGGKPTPVVLNWEIEQIRAKRELVLFVQLYQLPTGADCVHANDARGGRYWIPLNGASASEASIVPALQDLQRHVGKEVAFFPHGGLVETCRKIGGSSPVKLAMLSYPPRVDAPIQKKASRNRVSPHL